MSLDLKDLLVTRKQKFPTSVPLVWTLNLPRLHDLFNEEKYYRPAYNLPRKPLSCSSANPVGNTGKATDCVPR